MIDLSEQKEFTLEEHDTFENLKKWVNNHVYVWYLYELVNDWCKSSGIALEENYKGVTNEWEIQYLKLINVLEIRYNAVLKYYDRVEQ